jgi:hypothetical protein
VPVPNGALQQERTRNYADRFLEEMRRDLERMVSAGMDCLPRLRSVHERAGHATAEFRTLVIPALPGSGGLSPAVLSATIAYFAAKRAPDRLVLAMDALRQDEAGENQPVLIAEARDHAGTRLFRMQPYRIEEGRIRWEEPLNGGWVDPGVEDLILDGAFQPAP